MSMSDPVADLLTRIRNANMRNKESLVLLSSKIKLNIVKVLKEEGFIKDLRVAKDNNQGVLKIHPRAMSKTKNLKVFVHTKMFYQIIEFWSPARDATKKQFSRSTPGEN